MPRARNTRLSLFRACCVLGLSVWGAACGGPQKEGNSGTVCFRADDCRPGLACVPEAQGSSKRVCSADLSGIVSMVEGAPRDAAAGGGAPMGGAPAAGNGASPAKAGESGDDAAGAPSDVTTGGTGGGASAGASGGGASNAGGGASPTGSGGASPSGSGGA